MKTTKQNGLERMVIGESDRAGLPITAYVTDIDANYPIGCIRWHKRENVFALEQLHPNGRWYEVPVFVEKKP